MVIRIVNYLYRQRNENKKRPLSREKDEFAAKRIVKLFVIMMVGSEFYVKRYAKNTLFKGLFKWPVPSESIVLSLYLPCRKKVIIKQSLMSIGF